MTAINHQTREVTEEGTDGETVDLAVGETVKNLSPAWVVDRVTVEYFEAVTVAGAGPREVEGGAALTATGAAEPGAKLAEWDFRDRRRGSSRVDRQGKRVGDSLGAGRRTQDGGDA